MEATSTAKTIAPITVEVLQKIDDVAPREWDACADDGWLASTYRWNRALQDDFSIGQPIFFLVRRGRELLAIAVGLEMRFPLGMFTRARSLAQTISLIPPIAPLLTIPKALYLSPLRSAAKPGLYLKPGVDPEEVGPLLHDAFRTRPVSLIITTGLADDASDPVRALARVAVGGYVFPWLQHGMMPAIEPEQYYKTLSGHHRRRLKTNQQNAAQIGLRFETSPDVAAHAEDIAALLRDTHEHHRQEGRPITAADSLERPSFHRFLGRTFPGEVEAYLVRDAEGKIVASGVGLIGARNVMLTYWGMKYPPPPRVSLYNFLFAGAHQHIAKGGRIMRLGPDMHQAKALAGAAMVPMLARVAATSPLWDAVLRNVAAPWIFPSLDEDDWDAYKGWPKWFLKIQSFAEAKIAPKLTALRTQGKVDPFAEDQK